MNQSGRDLVGEARVKSFDTFDGAVLALLSGDADAVIIDEASCIRFYGYESR